MRGWDKIMYQSPITGEPHGVAYVAVFLDIPKPTLYRWMQRGDCPMITLRGTRRPGSIVHALRPLAYTYFMRRSPMAQISLNTPAPDFTLQNLQGEPVSLSDFRGKAHVLLVFNRGFT
jgi:hypothetical protein